MRRYYSEARFVSRTRETVFLDIAGTVCARHVEEIPWALAQVRAGVANGLHAAGYIAYEAAPGLDHALVSHESDGTFPLLFFRLYERREERRPTHRPGGAYALGAWQTPITREAYNEALARIRDYIAAGDCYQVNYTFPLHATFSGDAGAWFDTLCAAQQADHCAFLDTGHYAIVSASPELLFQLDGTRLITRPMKGTRPRGRWTGEDATYREALCTSPKEQAENVMIVDLLRNDMGRVARPGTVRVEELFTAERYETVWQLTSTIAAETNADVPAILGALFPSGSVTGAPKVRTMAIIRELEPCPRGVYCGTVGWWSPGGRASFNVAIRTAVVNYETGEATYGVGGGITWDSAAEAEYAECLMKAAILREPPPSFALLESLLWEEGAYFLLERHLERLAAAAAYFGFAYEETAVRQVLDETAAASPAGQPAKVRLLLEQDGTVRCETAPLAPATRWTVGFAPAPIAVDHPFVFHKTTHRKVYEDAKAARPAWDDVILWNAAGEVTESTLANLVIRQGETYFTPPVPCGLLAGTLRAELLAQGKLEERVLHKEDVLAADEVWLINSVRRWIAVTLEPDA